MNNVNTRKKGLNKTAAAALAMIGTSALVFGWFSQSVLAADLDAPQTIPTSYTAGAPVDVGTPEGYVKTNYTTISDPLCPETAGPEALSAEQAAELGAQALWQLYGVNLEGATIYMGYSSGTETFPRAFWSGDVRFGPERTPQNPGYDFMLDAVTGERFSAAWGRQLDVTVPLGLDAALAENPQEYLDLGKKLATEKNIVHGDVQAVTYNSQGYCGNDPDITVNVIGVNGEKALLTFSRYDQALTGVGYDASRLVSEPAAQKLLDELDRQVAAARADGDNLLGDGVLIGIGS